MVAKSIEQACSDLRKNGSDLSRWGLFTGDDAVTRARWEGEFGGRNDWRGPNALGCWDAVCYAALYDSLGTVCKKSTEPVGFYSSFNGYTPDDGSSGYQHSVSSGANVGTKESRLWLEYLLGEDSPWAALHPFIKSKDLDWVNDNGIIFSDVRDVPCKLLFNFLQAYRKAYEYPGPHHLWMELKEEFPIRVADFLTLALRPPGWGDHWKKATVWKPSEAFSGHLHLHDNSPHYYYKKYTAGKPSKAGLKTVFKDGTRNPGHNTNIWYSKQGVSSEKRYSRNDFALFLMDLDEHNAKKKEVPCA